MTADNYTIASGATLSAGCTPPPTTTPLWAVGAPINAWIEIPGTSGAGGTNMGSPGNTTGSYSGWAQLPSGKLAIALAGGHGDGNKNNVAVINLLANSPAWAEVCAQSPTHTNEVAYEADGKPTCCHTYYCTMWVPQKSRLMRFGAYAVPISSSTSFPTVDGFNLATNTWDAAGTYPDISPAGSYGVGINPNTGDVLLSYGAKIYAVNTGVTSATSVGSVNMPRSPWAWDTVRNHFFGLCYGDNQGSSLFLGVVAAKIVGTTASQITFNSSAALTQLASDVPQYAGMLYDPVNDCYLFYCGTGGTAGRVYKITPNNSSVWDIAIFSYGAGGVSPISPMSSGLMNKFSYIPELNGVVMMATSPSNLYFMRTA